MCWVLGVRVTMVASQCYRELPEAVNLQRETVYSAQGSEGPGLGLRCQITQAVRLCQNKRFTSQASQQGERDWFLQSHILIPPSRLYPTNVLLPSHSYIGISTL